MLKPFANSARSIASEPLTWKTWTGLILIPVIIMGLLTWAFWAPRENHGTAQAAVVNLDEPVKVRGQIVPLGRLLAGNLTHSKESPYSWVLTDADNAAEGLADGTYTASVTIPKDFSADATSTGKEEPLDAVQARLQVRASNAAGVVDPDISDQIARATQQALNKRVVETYLDQIYRALTTIHDKLKEAAEGAGKLADGSGKLADGAHKLADGAEELEKGADQLAGGANQLAKGTAQLAVGSDKLADGLTQAERDTARLPELTRKLAEGARQVAEGNEQLADTVVPLANRIIEAIDALPPADEALEELQQIVSQCEAAGDLPFCDDLREAVERFSGDIGQIDAARELIRDSAVNVRDSISALAKGARAVARGNAALADKAQELVDGIATAAAGARKLASGAERVDEGAHKLADGAGKLADGSGQLADGAGKLAGGADRLTAGAEKLASGLADGAKEIPHYSKAERDHLKLVAATPTTVPPHDGDGVGLAAMALFVVIALWSCALATYVVARPVPAAVLTSREPTWLIILRASVPGATAAMLAAVTVSLVLAPFLDLSFWRWVAFLAVAWVAAGAFVALNQAAAAVFKTPGRLASLAVLVLTLATGVVSSIPGPLYDVASFLPTHGAVLALRSVANGDAIAVSGIVQLVGWLLVGLLASVIVTDRRRFLSGRQLRPGSLLPGTT